MVKINETIFKDYDIRGTYPDQLNEDTYYILGRAVASYFKVKEIAVGYDARLSSPSLKTSFIKGIIAQGVDAVDLGMISTEIHNFASGRIGFPVNCIISASHNPANYNGLKIIEKGVVPIHGNKGIPQIKNLSVKQIFETPKIKGRISKKNIIDQWIDFALGFVNLKDIKKMKVVIDAGNGMGGISWKKIIETAPFEIIPMYFEPDGHFPNHLPDPLKLENISSLCKKVIKTKADLGFAIDGDADRIFLVDDLGKPVSGTITTAILSEHLIKKWGAAPVLYNTACGKIVPETIQKFGGKPIRVRVGHSFIKEYMKKYGAVFAGEHSGHFYLSRNSNSESAFISGLLILEYLTLRKSKLSDIVKSLSKYFASGEHSFEVNDIKSTMEKVERHFQGQGKIDHIDGLSIFFDDWWFNLRASKTEPLLRLNMEADTQDILNNKLHYIKNIIK